ncbi:thermonuclease family protein [Flavobacteriaceae bacterium]|nr:thermonuclease family protein [Flavobacteriaceae bacterium]
MMKKLLLLLLFIPLVSFGQDVKVIRIIDGDTFEIENGDKVRMIGIDAPELKDNEGLESKNHLKLLIENKYVSLIEDKKNKNKDFFGRLLRYVYIENTDVNLKMIEDGYANVYTKFKFTKSQEYINLNKKK